MPGFTLPKKNPHTFFSTFRFSHSCLRVRDFSASKAWFMEKLDFRLVIEWPGPIGVKMAYLAAANDDRCVIEIIGGGEVSSTSPATSDLFSSLGNASYHHICFTVPNVEAEISKLRKREVTIVAEAFDVAEIGRKIAFFSDPFGNLFELEELYA